MNMIYFLTQSVNTYIYSTAANCRVKCVQRRCIKGCVQFGRCTYERGVKIEMFQVPKFGLGFSLPQIQNSTTETTAKDIISTFFL